MEDPSAGRVPQYFYIIDATAQGQKKDRAQPHPESHSVERMTPKGKPCRILLWLLMFIVGVCSVAGETYPLCDGESVAAAVALQKGNVTIVCPLTADVRQSKQSLVIKYYSPNSTTGEEVLGCDWLSNRQAMDCLPSPFEATLVEIQPDLVIASLPKTRLGNGSYRCQLVPYDRKQPYTDCDICYPGRDQEDDQEVLLSSRLTSDKAGSDTTQTVVIVIVIILLIIFIGIVCGIIYWRRERVREFWSGLRVREFWSGLFSQLCPGATRDPEIPQPHEGIPLRDGEEISPTYGDTPTSTPRLDVMTATPQQVFQSSPRQLHQDSESPWITAIACMPDDRLVMTDIKNKNVKVMDMTPPHALSTSTHIPESP
ncbi:hypothetical protein ACOMHN_054583 [Nucella lapillus]